MKTARSFAPCITFVLIIGALVFNTAFFFSRPSIEFDRLEHDFGTVPEMTTQSCEFVFFNRGSGTLIIERVSAG